MMIALRAFADTAALAVVIVVLSAAIAAVIIGIDTLVLPSTSQLLTMGDLR